MLIGTLACSPEARPIRRFTAIAALIAPFVVSAGARATEIWSGYDFAFSKANNADWTLPANQDRITDSVWITRATLQGIFNIAQEASYSIPVSPADTRWAYGTTADIGSLTFQVWRDAVAGLPPASVGQNMVVHLLTDDIYIDIRFTSWTVAADGGGFAYVRALPPPPACAGDIDGDADTDVFDFAILAANFGGSVPLGSSGDLDNDGDVDILDFGALAADFGCVP